MTHPLRSLFIAILIVIGLGVPKASTAPASGVERLAMADIPMDTRRILQPPPSPEELLLESLSSLRAGDSNTALDRVNRLIDKRPTYRLAHLVRGDILASIGGRMPSIVETDRSNRDNVDNLIAEARQRLVGTTFDPDGRVPSSILKLSEKHQHVIYIDTDLSRLYLFENRNGDPTLLSDYYVSIGKNGSGKRRKGDKRTPLGVYFVTERLPGAKLPDKYGPVAFPVNYPNEWDRRNKRTGSGIWLHGVASSSYSRPPQDSDGCVALINEELVDLSPNIVPGLTPVVIGNNGEWIEYKDLTKRRQEVSQAVDQWRQDWEGGNVDHYLSHYDSEFQGKGMNLNDWKSYKRNVSKGKTHISVELSDLSIFSYPDENDMIVVTFRQHYESNNFNGSTRKRQYWRKGEDKKWRILSEESATTG